MVEELEQMLGDGSRGVCDALPPPKQDFRKLHVLTRCSAKEESEVHCIKYRPSALNGCAFQGKLEDIKTCLSVGAV